MAKERQILIIGAGIGGLAAGCYGQMNGYDTRIFEMHNLPGGVCTAWRRRGYTFDGCIHHLAGCRPGEPLYRMWRDLGAVPRPLLYPEELASVEAPEGESLTAYTDLDRLEAHLKDLAPDDADAIEDYVVSIRRAAALDLMELSVASPRDLARLLPLAVRNLRWFRDTMAGAGARFRNPRLRHLFPWLQYAAPRTPAALHLNMMAQCSRGNYGWPEGGSLAFARSVADRYRDLGGHLHYHSRVTRILVEDDRAVGVRLVDGSERRADIVVSAAYTPTTIFDLLGGRYVNSRLHDHYTQPVDAIDMGLHVSLGVDRDLSAEPHALVCLLDEPVEIADEERDHLHVHIYAFDPTMAPPGKSALKVTLRTSYSYWETLRQDRKRYRAEKERVAEAVIARLEPRFPGLSDQIDVVDVATPLTTDRYTGNKGAFDGLLAPELGGLLRGRGLVRTLPGLDDFYMVGQWAGFPGLPVVAGMGRSLIRFLCRRDRRPFIADVAD